MKKVVKIISAFCATALISTTFVGCGQSGTTSGTQATGQAAPAKPVTLRFSWWGSDSRHKATLDAIALYKQKNPNITIEAEYQGFDGYQQKLSTQLASAAAPDLMQVDSPWLPDYTSKSDFFADLYTQKDVDTKGFDDKFLKSFTVFNNKLVGLPMGINGRTMIFNKTLADKVGIDFSNGLDWDGLITMAQKLRAVDKKYYLLNADFGVNMIDVVSILKQKTGNQIIKDDYTIGFTKDDLTYALTWLKKAFDAGVYQPAAESSLFEKKTEQNPKWINSEIVGIEDWSSGVTKIQGSLPKDVNVTVSLPPVLKDGKTGAAVVRPSMVLCVNNKSVSVSEASKFASWLLNDNEAAVILGDERAVPASESARKAAGDAGKINKNVIAAVETAQKNTQFADNNLSSNTQISDILKDIIQKVLFDKETVDQAATEMISRFNDKLKELKSSQK